MHFAKLQIEHAINKTLQGKQLNSKKKVTKSRSFLSMENLDIQEEDEESNEEKSFSGSEDEGIVPAKLRTNKSNLTDELNTNR